MSDLLKKVLIFLAVSYVPVCFSVERGLAAGVGIGAELVDSGSFAGSESKSLFLEYQINRYFSIEFEQIRGSVDGQLEVFSEALIDTYSDFLSPTNNGAAFVLDYNADLETKGVYAVFRTDTIFYFMAKVGRVEMSMDASLILLDFGLDLGGDEQYTSGGLGGGIRFSKKLSAELEGTYIDEAGLGFLTMGLRYKF